MDKHKMSIKNITIILICIFTMQMIHSQTKSLPNWQSSHVYIDEIGTLTYTPDKQGNTIPDFSRVGYHHGAKSIPCYPVVKVITPVKGDNWKNIQMAIDEISKNKPGINGHRGTILLKRGEYRVSKSIVISTSGIVLKGEGDNVNETRIIATGRHKYPLIEIKGEGKYQEVINSRVKITDEFVPVGSHSFRVTSADPFKVGDRIILFRPGTTQWIEAIRMNQIVERPGTRQWKADEYNLAFEREITGIEGNCISIDNPVVMQMEKQYGGGEIYKYRFDGRIHEVGVSDMYLESEYQSDDDTEHGWIAVQLDNAENCWVKNITTVNFGYSAVSCERFAKNITVSDARCFDPKSPITGGMRYSFNNNGQQNLFMNCLSRNGRHDYVTGARVCGPNVFYNCVSVNAFSDIGPHHRWATGTLYDNVVTDKDINVQDRGNMGSGHGWAGVTQVLWNCRAERAAVQKPWASGNNYNIGMKGNQYPGHFKDREDGVWEGLNKENLVPRSLYQAQLQVRMKVK
jgi:hypothetical protein